VRGILVLLNEDGDPTIDPAQWLSEWVKQFTDTVIDPEDKLAKRVIIARALGSPLDVLRKLEHDVDHSGPALNFVTSWSGHRIRGIVKRRVLDLRWDDRLPDSDAQQLITFLIDSASVPAERIELTT
jgi:hypothetical protein